MRRAHDMPFGASVAKGGGVRFALWAPSVDEVVLEYGPDRDLASQPWVRDSRFNPEDVHSPSQVVHVGAFTPEGTFAAAQHPGKAIYAAGTRSTVGSLGLSWGAVQATLEGVEGV